MRAKEMLNDLLDVFIEENYLYHNIEER